MRRSWHLVTALLALSAPARADTLEDTLRRVESDLGFMLADGPVYLAGRLPALVSGADFLSSMELTDVREFSLGVSVTSALLTDFDRLDDSFQMMPQSLPSVVPMPVLNFVGRIGVARGLDVGMKAGFFPELDVRYRDTVITGSIFHIGVQARYRVLAGRGVVPDLVTQLGFGFFSGYLKVGKDYAYDFDEDVPSVGAVAGSLRFTGAPVLGWTLFQLAPAIVARWNLRWFHPYIGAAIDLTLGHVDGGLDLELELTLTRPTPSTAREKITETMTSTSPRVFGLRPMLGLEIDLTRRLKVVLQADLGYYVRQSPGDLRSPGLEEQARREAPQGLYVQTLDGEPLSPLVFVGGLGVRYDYH